MKKDKIYWYFPICFFLFLSIFIGYKFIFIFFFRAAYEPAFIFDLTPYSLLAGVNSLQILFLSATVVLFNTFLHLRPTRKNLMISFLPTIIMLSGLGVSITTEDFTLTNIFHYLVFSVLLCIILIDHRHSLSLSDTIIITKKEPDSFKSIKTPKIDIRSRRQPLLSSKTAKKAPRVSFAASNAFFSLFKNVRKTHKIKEKEYTDYKKKKPLYHLEKDETDIKPLTIYKEKETVKHVDKPSELKFDEVTPELQKSFNEIDNKIEKLQKLENEIEGRRKDLVEQERTFNNMLISFNKKRVQPNLHLIHDIKIPNAYDKKIKDDDRTFLNEIQECAAIIQRGLLKQINQSFADLLGYTKDDIENKSLFNLIVPESLNEIKDHYLKRLKGIDSSSYETIFLTKENDKVPVEVSFIPTTFNGEKAEILVFKKISKKF